MTQGCHVSDFHRVTQYGSNICHASVTCDTTCHEQGVPIMEISYTMYHFVFKWSWKDPPPPQINQRIPRPWQLPFPYLVLLELPTHTMQSHPGSLTCQISR